MASSTSHVQTPSPESVLNPNYWDVFINFRGQDTRYTFTDHLYKALDRSSIKTFRDIPELRTGGAIKGQLMQSIKKAKTYIVVFSQHYAFSYWCLDELVEIIKYCESTKRTVIPVFYNIEAAVVGRQTGKFQKAFEKHKTRYDEVRIKNWRDALEKMGKVSGYPVGKKMYEGDIMKEIVERVLDEITPKTLPLPEYAVGLEARVKDITALLNSAEGEEGVIKIGIYGMGGVGKTTLAKAFFNKNFQSFEGSSFLKDVREESSNDGGLVRLQEQLIKNVCKLKNKRIDNDDSGFNEIKTNIAEIQVLIVIDDLVKGKPLEFIKGPFAAGSRIIITTRNEDLLDSIGVKAKYKVNELDHAESLQLFSHRVFKGNKIPDKFTKWSNKILARAGGLPLALSIFGFKLINNHDKDGWKCFIERMERVSISEVKEKLLISYNALEFVDQKNIFLDIACFFIGREEQEVVKIMKTYYKSSSHKINNMKQRSLISNKDKDNLLGMHPLFQDLGRKIVLGDDPLQPAEKRSRLWLSEDICTVLEKKTGTNAIEGIVPEDNQNALYNEKSYAMDTFINMTNLRFLHIENKNFNTDFNMAPKDLSWLCWGRFPSESLPSEFFLENIKMLEFPHSEMITMWQPSKVFGNLNTLSMKCSGNLTTTPDFKNLPGLKTLNFKGCKSLKDVHTSIGSLVKLDSLDLGDCVNLTSLPNIICNLKALKVLCINGCISLTELPTDLGSIGTLEKLNAKQLTVSNLPDSIGKLSNLVELILSDNKNLGTLPDTLCLLGALEVLSIDGCSSLQELPMELGKLKSLKVLNAISLTVLQIPDSIGLLTELVELKLGFNDMLTQLPDTISNLTSLEKLDLTHCHQLMSIPELPSNVKWVNANDCESLVILAAAVFNLKQLEYLYLTNCTSLTEIQGAEGLTSLREIHLGGCNSSLLACTLTEGFFQTGSGHQTQIFIPAGQFPNWISELSSCTGQSSNAEGTTMSIDLSPNFLTMILRFEHSRDCNYDLTTYSIKNIKSGFIWSGSFDNHHNEEAQMIIIVPSSIFSVTDDDNKIEFTTNAPIIEIYLRNTPEIFNMIEEGNGSASEEINTIEEGHCSASEEIIMFGDMFEEGNGSTNEDVNTIEEGNGSAKEINMIECNGSATFKINRIEGKGSANEEINMTEQGKCSTNEVNTTDQEGKGNANEEINTIEEGSNSVNEKINTTEEGNDSGNQEINTEDFNGSATVKIDRIEVGKIGVNKEIDTTEDSNGSANEEINMTEDGNPRANKKIDMIEEGNGNANQETNTIKHVNGSATNKINRIEVSNISANEVIHMNQESNRGTNYQEIEIIEAGNDSANQELDRINMINGGNISASEDIHMIVEGVPPELLLENKDGRKRTKWYTPWLKLMCISDSQKSYPQS